jgi:hypothetical protein
MAKLLWIGENVYNKSGLSAKAYLIRRTGRHVVMRYGPVESVGGMGGRVHWLSMPRIHERLFRTIRRASEFVRQQTLRKADGGYDRLPGRVRIHRKRSRCEFCGS